MDYRAGLVPPQTEEWVRRLYAFCQTGGSLAELDLVAGKAPESWKLAGEAYFDAGALRLAEGDRAGALDAFLRAYRSFDDQERYTYLAKLLVVRMQKNLAWPPWVAVSWDAAPETIAGQAAGGVVAPSLRGEERP